MGCMLLARSEIRGTAAKYSVDDMGEYEYVQMHHGTLRIAANGHPMLAVGEPPLA